jgi:hypothetical protein
MKLPLRYKKPAVLMAGTVVTALGGAVGALLTAQELLLLQNGTMASAWCGVSTALLTASAALERARSRRRDMNAGRQCPCACTPEEDS